MNCDEISQLLSARLDGELTEEETAALEAHLAACPECRALSQQLEALRGAFSRLEDVSAPEGFARRVMEQISPEAEQPKVIPLFRRRWVKAAMGAAACLVLCVGLLSAGLIGSTDQPGAAIPFAARMEEPEEAAAPEAQAKTVPGEGTPITGEPVTVEAGFGSLTVTVPEGWDCETVKNEGSIAVLFAPEGETGRISLVLNEKPAGVCGTGLVTEERPISDSVTALVSTYDHHSLWDFMDFGEEPGLLMAWTQEGVERWWEDRGDVAMEILSTAVTEFYGESPAS